MSHIHRGRSLNSRKEYFTFNCNSVSLYSTLFPQKWRVYSTAAGDFRFPVHGRARSVWSTIVSKLFPTQEHVWICGRENFASDLQTDITQRHIRLIYGIFKGLLWVMGLFIHHAHSFSWPSLAELCVSRTKSRLMFSIDVLQLLWWSITWQTEGEWGIVSCLAVLIWPGYIFYWNNSVIWTRGV